MEAAAQQEGANELLGLGVGLGGNASFFQIKDTKR